MSYDITGKAFQEIDGVRVKVFAGLTHDGKVMRQTSQPGASELVQIGEVDMSKGMEHAQAEFERITEIAPYASAEELEPVTGELKADKVAKTSPGRTQKKVNEAAGDPEMPVIGKARVEGEPDIDAASVSTANDGSAKPTETNKVAEATAEREANEAGQISDVQQAAIDEELPANDEVPEPKDSGEEITLLSGETIPATKPTK